MLFGSRLLGIFLGNSFVAPFSSPPLLLHAQRTAALTTMSSSGKDGGDRYEGFTTNAEDLAQAAAIKAKLRAAASSEATTSNSNNNNKNNAAATPLPSVVIAPGIHKYVLIQALCNGNKQYIVTSRQHAAYHRDAAEPMIAALERAGYTNIDVTGGGRIDCNEERKSMKIFGYSYGFGLADHSISQRVVAEDARYADFDITISNEGY